MTLTLHEQASYKNDANATFGKKYLWHLITIRLLSLPDFFGTSDIPDTVFDTQNGTNSINIRTYSGFLWVCICFKLKSKQTSSHSFSLGQLTHRYRFGLRIKMIHSIDWHDLLTDVYMCRQPQRANQYSFIWHWCLKVVMADLNLLKDCLSGNLIPTACLPQFCWTHWKRHVTPVATFINMV